MAASGAYKSAKQLEARGRAWVATALACGALLALLATQQSRAPWLSHGIGNERSGWSASRRWAFGAGGNAGAAQHCDLDVLEGPLADTCALITDVCIDQVGWLGWQRGRWCRRRLSAGAGVLHTA